jgi:hypothetical protein
VIVAPIVDVSIAPAREVRVEPSAKDLAARYVEVGHALSREVNRIGIDAWVGRYRRIQIQQAMATPATRAFAMRELLQIERGIAR